MLEPRSIDWLIKVAKALELLECETVGKMLKRLLEWPAGADFEVGQMNIGGERRVARSQLARNTFERRLHREPRVRAYNKQIHEIRKARTMFELARRDALVDVYAWADISGNPAGDHHQPQKRSSGRSNERQKHEDRGGETNRQRRTRNEEEGNGARIVDTGLHEPPAQHLHVLVICRAVMLRRVLDQPGDCLLA